MFGLGPATRIYLAAGATDMRKGFDGLYGLVRNRLLPVELAARKSPTQPEPSCGLAVVLPGGHRIEVHPEFDTNTFKRLVGVLERV